MQGHDSVDTMEADVERRGLFGSVAVAAAALAGGGLLASTAPAQAQTVTDADVFNFALNSEYLGSEFYLRAVTGTGLSPQDTTGTGTLGSVTGGSQVPFRSSYIQQIATKIAVDEQTHLKFLRTVLGPNAIARPQINFTDAFTTLAINAGLIVPGQTFNPFADEISFLLGAFVLEDVEVTAYAGSARLITGRDNVAYAGSILAVEAYHAAALRSTLANLGGSDAVNRIAALRGRLSPGGEAPLSIGDFLFNFAPTDDQGQAFRRTPRQVLNILYGAPNATSGLFFPAGVNGTIRS